MGFFNFYVFCWNFFIFLLVGLYKFDIMVFILLYCILFFNNIKLFLIYNELGFIIIGKRVVVF